MVPPQVERVTTQHVPNPLAQLPCTLTISNKYSEKEETWAEPDLAEHCGRVRQVPVSPVIASHARLGKVTIVNRLQI